MGIFPEWKTWEFKYGSAIKFQSLKESGLYLPLTNCIFSFRHLEDFLAPGFYLNSFCFLFFVFCFFNLIKEYCYDSCWPKHGSSETFFCGSIVFVEDLVFEGKATKLAVLNFNSSLITHQVALKYASAREFWRERTVPRKPAGHMAA